MKIKITTSKICLEVEDEPTIGKDNYTKREVLPLLKCLEEIINKAIKLHNEAN